LGNVWKYHVWDAWHPNTPYFVILLGLMPDEFTCQRQSDFYQYNTALTMP
jgi:hypothetical protein